MRFIPEMICDKKTITINNSEINKALLKYIENLLYDMKLEFVVAEGKGYFDVQIGRMLH